MLPGYTYLVVGVTRYEGSLKENIVMHVTYTIQSNYNWANQTMKSDSIKKSLEKSFSFIVIPTIMIIILTVTCRNM